jgi:hypothetical protein
MVTPAAINKQRPDLQVRILHEPKDFNAAYVAIRRYKSESVELLDLLARDAWSRWCDIKIALNRYGPWAKGN